MKTGWVLFLGVLGIIVLMLGLTLGLGWFGVYQTKTVGKAQMNASRQVFEETQSYVQGMRADLLRYHHEWVNTKDPDSKIGIEATVRLQFASFSEDKYLTDSPELYTWLKNIKGK